MPSVASGRLSPNQAELLRTRACRSNARSIDRSGGDTELCRSLVKSRPEPTFNPRKTRAGRRSIELDNGTVAALKAEHKAQSEARLRLGAAFQVHDPVFCRTDGSAHYPEVISHQFEHAAERARLPRIRLHDLLHTHATLLLAAGVHPRVVQERLGHSGIAVTMDRYSNVVPSTQAEAAARLGRMVDGL